MYVDENTIAFSYIRGDRFGLVVLQKENHHFAVYHSVNISLMNRKELGEN